MLNVAYRLIHKLSLQIACRENDSPFSAAELAKGVLYDRLSEKYGLDSDWRYFSIGGSLSSADEGLKGRSVSAKTEDESIWAASFSVRDAEIARRRRNYFLCLRAQNEREATLYYAECYSDHMAGSIAETKPVGTTPDALPEALLFHRQIKCLCGRRTLPCEAQALTHSNLPDFLGLLQDNMRKQPVFLICCAEEISPEKLNTLLRGNAAVYWCAHFDVLARLNERMPRIFYTAWDSIRIFMPDAGEDTFHPTYSSEEIRRMGIERFSAGLKQAYCQSLRAEERKNFLTIDDVRLIQRRQQMDALTVQLAQKNERIAVLGKRVQALETANAALEDRLRLHSENKDALEYEALLSEAMRETDTLRQGAERLNAQLCSDMGAGFQPDPAEPSTIIGELAYTIYACLRRAADTRRRTSS